MRDTRSIIFGSKAIATVEHILAWEVKADHQPVGQREKGSDRCSTPAPDHICENLQPLLGIITAAYGIICARS